MTRDDILDDFRAAGALLEGHFILSSGLHSPIYLQKSLLLTEPRRAERLCRALARGLRARFGELPLVVSPAVGGIVVGHETARHLGARFMFTERENGIMTLRRGFAIKPGERVAMVEDIVTTGLSSRECIAAIRRQGGHVVAAACLVDRSGGKAEVGVPLVALASIDIPVYRAGDVPPELAAIPAVKPGSRGLR